MEKAGERMGKKGGRSGAQCWDFGTGCHHTGLAWLHSDSTFESGLVHQAFKFDLIDLDS